MLLLHEIVAAFLLLAMNAASAETVTIRFDAINVVTDSPDIVVDTLFDENEPIVRGDSDNYSGPDIYGALHRVDNAGLWTVGNQQASGLRIRFTTSEKASSVSGLFLIKAASAQFTAAADSMEASGIVTSHIEHLASARIRFVIQEAGTFYISEASPDFAAAAFNANATGNHVDQFSIHALDANWFSYDPVSSIPSKSSIGNSAKPSFDMIDFVGFALFAKSANTDDVATNFGTTLFTVTAQNSDTVRPTTAVIDGYGRYQVMEGFGASGAWYTGTVLRRSDAAAIIDFAFKDLALDIFRIRNVYEQEDYVRDTSDFSAVIAAGEASLGRPIKVLISGWSPPAEIKSNNQTRPGGTLASDPATGKYRYRDYARWWADSLDYFDTENIRIEYVSIQNEPNLAASHDSCLLDPVETAEVAGYNAALEAVYDEIFNRGANRATNTLPKMIGPETLSFDRFSNYIGNITDDSKLYGYAHHLYQGDLGRYPNSLNEIMDDVHTKYGNKPLFQTEFAVLNSANNTAIVRKLNLARLIHNALTIEQVSAYMYWALYWVGEQGLVVMTDNGEGAVLLTPEYYAFKHFSAFVHANWQRISATTPAKGIAMTAFQSPSREKVTLVLSNENAFPVALNISFQNLRITGGTIFRSSNDQDCLRVGNFENNTMLESPKESITTLLLDAVPSLAPCEICKTLRRRNCPACQTV